MQALFIFDKGETGISPREYRKAVPQFKAELSETLGSCPAVRVTNQSAEQGSEHYIFACLPALCRVESNMIGTVCYIIYYVSLI